MTLSLRLQTPAEGLNLVADEPHHSHARQSTHRIPSVLKHAPSFKTDPKDAAALKLQMDQQSKISHAAQVMGTIHNTVELAEFPGIESELLKTATLPNNLSVRAHVVTALAGRTYIPVCKSNPAGQNETMGFNLEIKRYNTNHHNVFLVHMVRILATGRAGSSE
jgi:hypothetical protein